MLVFALLPALALAVQDADQAAPGDEIVVTAVRQKCRMSIADRVLSDRDFRARAEEWKAGRRLVLRVPPGAHYRCLAKIVFRLNKVGVRNFAFAE